MTTIEGLAEDFQEMRSLAAAGVVVAHEMEVRSEQVAALVESAAVGLAARELTHKLRTHLSEIEQSTRAIRAMVQDSSHADRVCRHLRHIDLARRAISGAASQIDPMLPRTRAVKERIALASFISDYFAARQVEFEREGIGTSFSDKAPGAVVKMSRSRLLQVIDNMVLNSRYWLQDEDGPEHGEQHIGLTVDAREFILSDNGPGVDQKLETTIFDPFVTDKPANSSSQGLGLYIVTQLLLLDGCSIELLPERNDKGRRFRFRVDLTQVAA